LHKIRKVSPGEIFRAAEGNYSVGKRPTPKPEDPKVSNCSSARFGAPMHQLIKDRSAIFIPLELERYVFALGSRAHRRAASSGKISRKSLALSSEVSDDTRRAVSIYSTGFGE